MKVFLILLLIGCLQQFYSNGQIVPPAHNPFIQGAPACMSQMALFNATTYLCTTARLNQTLWDKIIACHRPMNDELLRASAEAQCSNPKVVQNANSTGTIQDVFFNICGNILGNQTQLNDAFKCVVFGQTSPYIMSHIEELKRTEGIQHNLSCTVGQCVQQLIDSGEIEQLS